MSRSLPHLGAMLTGRGYPRRTIAPRSLVVALSRRAGDHRRRTGRAATRLPPAAAATVTDKALASKLASRAEGLASHQGPHLGGGPRRRHGQRAVPAQRQPGHRARLQHQDRHRGRGPAHPRSRLSFPDPGDQARQDHRQHAGRTPLPQGVRRPDRPGERLRGPGQAGPGRRDPYGDGEAGRRRDLLRQRALQPDLADRLRRRLLRGGDLRADPGSQRRLRLRHGDHQVQRRVGGQEGQDHHQPGGGGVVPEPEEPDHHRQEGDLDQLLGESGAGLEDDHCSGVGWRRADPEPADHGQPSRTCTPPPCSGPS